MNWIKGCCLRRVHLFPRSECRPRMRPEVVNQSWMNWSEPRAHCRTILFPSSVQMFRPHLWRHWRDHTTTSLTWKPQRNSWQHIFGFRSPFWHAKTNTSNLAANVPNTIKKNRTETMKIRSPGGVLLFLRSLIRGKWSKAARRGATGTLLYLLTSSPHF